MVKRKFNEPYIKIDTKEKYPVVFTVNGNYSILIKMNNPCVTYNGDKDEYYNYVNIFTNLIKSLDSSYILQKHDIFSKQKWELPYNSDDFLMQKHFEQYEEREFKHQATVFILTCEIKRSIFVSNEERKFNQFIENTGKVLTYFANFDIKAQIMTKNEIENYLLRYFAMDFEDSAPSFDNFSVRTEGLFIGNKNIQCYSLVDVEMVDMPSFIKPFSKDMINNRPFPQDLFKFLPYLDAETVLFNQVIFTVNQAAEKLKLEAKMKRHLSVPDSANNLCVEDIQTAMDDMERNSQLLVYCHFDVILSDKKNLSSARNQLESFLSNVNVRMSKQAFNQYELYRAGAPGNAHELRNYDRFLTTADVAASLMFKEILPISEESDLMMWFTDRQGIPVAIDPSDLPMRTNRIDNRNKFVLGPSGSGKSFLMNTMLHQYLLANSDVVMVDVGHSYKGLCDYFNGRYITYSDENPISMNPFYIRQMEYTVEKITFLVNLIFLLYKDTHDKIIKVEYDLIQETIMSYFANYFAVKNEFTDEDKQAYIQQELDIWYAEEVHDDEENTLAKKMKKIEDFIEKHSNLMNEEKDSHTVTELNFSTFYEYAKYKIPEICKADNLRFENPKGENSKLAIDYWDFLKVLKKYYKGGIYQHILNNNVDKTLFDEKFIVFEIDNIQNEPNLFPIITLVIMDVYLQKMRLKKNKKIIVIEEAWKALASPLMADYIKYLYKTVRKHHGEAITVTQELDDILKSEVVRQSIIANSGTFILCEQTKFKDNFHAIAEILSLSEVEQNKIFTINALDNKMNRTKFKEFYIKRGNSGEVYGNEVSLYEYFTYTTEKPEKDALQVYLKVYKKFHAALQAFVNDLTSLNVDKSEFCTLINHKVTSKNDSKGISFFNAFIVDICRKYKDSGLSINAFLINYSKLLKDEKTDFNFNAAV